MSREVWSKALIPVFMITFTGLCALAPLYVMGGYMIRTMNTQTR
jgi:hypothetical protein